MGLTLLRQLTTREILQECVVSRFYGISGAQQFFCTFFLSTNKTIVSVIELFVRSQYSINGVRGLPLPFLVEGFREQKLLQCALFLKLLGFCKQHYAENTIERSKKRRIGLYCSSCFWRNYFDADTHYDTHLIKRQVDADVFFSSLVSLRWKFL